MIGVIDGLWKDIQGEDWAQSGILKIEAEGYIRKKNAKTELEAIAEEFFRTCLKIAFRKAVLGLRAVQITGMNSQTRPVGSDAK